jgi:hypothetical protein
VVTDAVSNIPVSAPQPPTYCYDQPGKCVNGSMQMVFVYQQDGNNIDVPPGAAQQLAPGYSRKNGFNPGAQDDIFVSSIDLSSEFLRRGGDVDSHTSI